MTKYQWHNPEAAVQKSSLTGSSKALYDDVREFMEGLEKEGLLADTGEKSWSELSGRFETVWEPSLTESEKCLIQKVAGEVL
jgi:hypothetical protein